MKLVLALVAAAVVLAGCSSSAVPAKSTVTVTKPASSPTSTAISSATATAPTPTPTLALAISTAPPEVESIDLSANWKALKADIISGWGATCLLTFSCQGTDPLSEASVDASYVGVTGQEQIKVEYTSVTGDTTNDGAVLDLGHFALFFATDTVSQFDFQGFVTTTLDAIAVGGTKVKIADPLKITVEHPTVGQWLFVVDQS